MKARVHPIVFIFCMVFITACYAQNTQTRSVTFHVAPTGNDADPGTREKPFATLKRAQRAVTENLTRAPKPKTITVRIAGGTYYLSEPIKIAGTGAETEIRWTARPEDTVRISGGREIKGFIKITDPAVLKRLAPEVRGKVFQADLTKCGIEDLGEAVARTRRAELFFCDEPMQLARWPQTGFVTIADVAGKTSFKVHGRTGTKEGKLVYTGDRPERWLKEKEIYLHGYWFWDWSDSFEKVASIDPEKKIIATAPPYHNYGFRKGQRYYAINLLCELDTPGEWYIDRRSSTLYFYPPKPIGEGKAVLSVLPHLFTLENASKVTIERCILEATRSTAVTIKGGTSCRVRNCIIRNTGSWAVTVSGGNRAQHGVEDCHIYQVGEGGVVLRAGSRRELIPGELRASNNHIHHFGRLYRTYRPAVSISGVGNTVTHNLIHHGPHNAIQLGGNDHTISYNEIHTVCFETGDVGAFYMGRDWTARGTVIECNYFHHIQGPGLHGAMAVYLDDAASGITIRKNVFYKAGRAAFIGGGRDNLVENNIFVECPASVHVDARGIGWMKYHVEPGGTLPTRLKAMPYKKPPWSTRYPKLVSILEDDPGSPKGNIVRRNISFGGKWLNVEKKALPLITFENNLVDKDPGFVNPAKQDFRLKKESPAFKLGFEPIPIDAIGIETGRQRFTPSAAEQ